MSTPLPTPATPRGQVLVVRTDLKMTSGKIAAQCGYVSAALALRHP